jgi:protein TonB
VAFSYFASLVVHAAIIAPPLMWISRSDFGTISRPSRAISTERNFSVVLDALNVKPENQSAPASAASVAGSTSDRKPVETLKPVESQPREVKAVETEKSTNEILATEPRVPKARTADPPEGVKVIGGSSQSQIAVSEGEAPQHQTAELSARESQATSQDRSSEKSRHPKREDGERRAEKETVRPKGSRESKSSNGAGKSGGRVSASRGDILSYAALVRARVASRRPSGYGAHGRVVVSFSVTPGGGLGSARIASSSGSGALDSAALGAVRGAAPFPPPPNGAGAIRFSVPFYYR